jgi:outer membrane protein OmpA-like peptidoglycan-associated protein
VIDRLDRCPAVAGHLARQGCPPPDADGDGLADEDDRCPGVAGPVEGQGCPDVDTDGDGLVDRLDACPEAREVWNGVADDDGCPDHGRELAAVTETAIVLHQPIFFAETDAKIQARSFRLLGTIATLLEIHPEIKRLRIEGHTDDRGPRERNLELSQRRAETVRDYLIQAHGIAAERLEARGFGPDRALASNRTTAGRAKNRRCELVIVKETEVEGAPPVPR